MQNNNLPSNQSLFNGNDLNQTKSLFKSINFNQGVNIFDNSNEIKENPLFNFSNNNQGKSLFENNKFQIGGNIDIENNKFNQGSLFNDNLMIIYFLKIILKIKKEGISRLNNLANDKSLFNFNNSNPFNDNNDKSLFKGEINFKIGKDTFGNEQNKIKFGQKKIFENNNALFHL